MPKYEYIFFVLSLICLDLVYKESEVIGLQYSSEAVIDSCL